MTAPWYHRPVVGLDTETTAADPHDPATEIIQVALVVVMPDGTVTDNSWSTIVAPTGEIPAEATAVHGITTEQARAEGADPKEVAARLFDGLWRTVDKDLPVVAFNASFDLTLVRRLLIAHNGMLPDGMHVIDPLVCDRHLDSRRRGSRRLDTGPRHYGVDLDDGDAHDAMADAVAACQAAFRMGAEHPAMQCDLALLHRRQQAWHAEWAAGFADYRLTKDPTTNDVPWVSWPLPDRPVIEAVAA